MGCIPRSNRAFLMPWIILPSEIFPISDMSMMAANTDNALSHNLCVFWAALLFQTTFLGIVEAMKLSNSSDLVHLQLGMPSFLIFFFLEAMFSFDLKATSIKAPSASVSVKMMSSSLSLERGSSSEFSPSSDLGCFHGQILATLQHRLVWNRVATGSCELEPPVDPLFRAATSNRGV